MNRELTASILPNKSIILEWKDLEEAELINKSKQLIEEEMFRRYNVDFFSSIFYIGFTDLEIKLSDSLEFWRSFSNLLVKKIYQNSEIENLRENATFELSETELIDLIIKEPFMIGFEYLDEDLLKHLWNKICLVYADGIKNFIGTVEVFVKQFNTKIHLAGRVYFHLVENKKEEEYPFAFLTTYSEANKHIPLKFALEQYGENSKKLLELISTISLVAKKSKFINELLESGDIFHPLLWTSKDALNFLKEIKLYEESGVLCRIPDWWKKSKSYFGVRIVIGSKENAGLGIKSLLNFKPSIVFDGEELSEEEINKIIIEAEGLALIKGKWVAVDKDKIEQIQKIFAETKKQKNISILDAIRLELGISNRVLAGQSDTTAPLIEVKKGQWYEALLDKLKNPKLEKEKPTDINFKATLRPYQSIGLNWLVLMNSIGFGSCLADDMGLGKTVQILGFLNSIREDKKTNLLIVPASLLSNWEIEINKFFPSLKYIIIHQSNIETKNTVVNEEFLNQFELVITSYASIIRKEIFKIFLWNYIILDEAQNIKNPSTKQTLAIKELQCFNRIALTGTPVENSLADLWSIFDFINPGLLGTAKEFSNFSKNIQKNKHSYSKLRQVISPYMLRRLKTDKSIISDLPDKVEMKVYSELSPKQIVLYKKFVDDLAILLNQDNDAIKRNGIILSSIIKLKQICNHSAQYLGNNDYAQEGSGKFQRLRELCDTILQKRERVLVFTQFREITKPLNNFLSIIFEGRQGLILDGSTPIKVRKELVNKFQGRDYVPFFILSLKAGGVGLNLTEANHVIHFDRWWNPAVENQATDRAFRIGQNKNVMVHKFITRGTIEEKIDQMIDSKLNIFNKIIEVSGENLLCSMKNEEILDMFKFRL